MWCLILKCSFHYQVHKINTRRDSMTSYQRKKVRLTNMLVTLMVVYLLCNIPRVFNEVTKLLFNYTYAEYVAFTNLLVIANSSVNYLIYCAFGKSFRQSFVNLFFHCGKCKCDNCTRLENNDELDGNACDCFRGMNVIAKSKAISTPG
jgi:hypothetical protein